MAWLRSSNKGYTSLLYGSWTELTNCCLKTLVVKTAGPHYIAPARTTEKRLFPIITLVVVVLLLPQEPAVTQCLQGHSLAVVMFAEPYRSNSCLCLFRNSGFQQRCHTIKAIVMPNMCSVTVTLQQNRVWLAKWRFNFDSLWLTGIQNTLYEVQSYSFLDWIFFSSTTPSTNFCHLV
jgi:hypothetical protein